MDAPEDGALGVEAAEDLAVVAEGHRIGHAEHPRQGLVDGQDAAEAVSLGRLLRRPSRLVVVLALAPLLLGPLGLILVGGARSRFEQLASRFRRRFLLGEQSECQPLLLWLAVEHRAFDYLALAIARRRILLPERAKLGLELGAAHDAAHAAAQLDEDRFGRHFLRYRAS